ncbi:MAG: hypothetical protein JWQ20_1931 [Conexibacter sp.]|nr:hypothetical protein [Conexibacter sp.]
MTIVPAVPGSPEPVDPAPGPLEAQIIDLEAARVRRLVGALPPLERRVVNWRYGLDGPELTVRQVAARLKVSVRTAWLIEQRGLEYLREGWSADDVLAA